MIQIDFAVYWIAALLLLVLPLDWLFAVMFAAVFHEICHIAAVILVKGSITKLRVQPGGCIMETCQMEVWQQFLSIFAGPLGSFSLLVLCRWIPKIAICGLFQGLYNLIPVLPLDGGRLLRLLLYRCCPQHADRILDCIAIGFCLVIDILAIWFSATNSAGSLPAVFAVLWNIKLLSGKIPCKQSEIGVQ